MEEYKEFNGVEDFFKEVTGTLGSSDFENYLYGVISTDQIDTHNHRLTIDALKSFEKDINTKGLPFNVYHDPRIPPIGKILAAKLIASNDGKKNYLFGVMATYKQDFYKPFPAIPEISLYSSDIHDFSNDKIKIEFSDVEIDSSIIKSALDIAPAFVARPPVKTVRKDANPITVLSFVIPGLLVYPFIRSYLSGMGKDSAEIQKKFIKWIIESITKKLKRRILYKFASPYRGCQVDFVIETDSPEHISIALEKVLQTGQNVQNLIDYLIDEEPVELVYVYDTDIEKWIPSYLKNAKGEISTDTPYLMSAEKFGGLSIGIKQTE